MAFVLRHNIPGIACDYCGKLIDFNISESDLEIYKNPMENICMACKGRMKELGIANKQELIDSI